MDMRKRLLNFNIVAILLMFLTPNTLATERNKCNTALKLIPSYAKIQYGGGMGLLSFGTGWAYGKHNQGETDMFFGFIPKYSTYKAKATFTLKQNYIPWSIQLAERFSVEPFSVGAYLNVLFDNEFWLRQPLKYEAGYYRLPSKMRFHLFCGQRITFNAGKGQNVSSNAISLFYELSTCDILLISRLGNSYLRPKDYLRLSFGLKYQFL